MQTLVSLPRWARRAQPAVLVLASSLLAAACAEHMPTASPARSGPVVSADKVVADAPGGRLLVAQIDGLQPVPNAKADHAGDGLAEFTVNLGQQLLCASVTVHTEFQGDIIEAHIHPAVRGSASPILVADLTPALLPALAETGLASGCITLERDVLKAIAKHPADFYFNLHTPQNGIPDGGILRGQLSDGRP